MIDDKIISSHELKKELDKLPEQRFFPTGMKWLDELTGKFAEGDFIVIGGSQKSGKSLLAITLTRNFIEQKINCLWFEIELPYREFLERFGEELPVFYLPKVLNVPTLTWIEQKIDEAVKKYNTKIIFIDDLGMITDENMYKQNNSVDILDTRLLTLKRMAVRKNICIVGVNPFVSASLRKKKTEMDTSDFRGCITGDMLIDNAITGERKRIDEIKDYSNLYILGINKDNKLEKQKVLWLGETGIKDIYKITTTSGRVVKVSGQELFYNGEIWERADKLQKGNPIVLAQKLVIEKTKKELTENEAELLGWLLGDGWFGSTTQLTIRDYDYEENYIKLLAEGLKIFPKFRKSKKGKYREVYLSPRLSKFHSKIKNEFIEKIKKLGLFKKTGENKFIPEIFYQEKNDVVASLLRGLFHTDGCIETGEKRISFSNISRKMVFQIQYLLLRFGIQSKIYYQKPRKIYNGNFNKPSWRLFITGKENLILFNDAIGMLFGKKEKLVNSIKAFKNIKTHTDFELLPFYFTQKALKCLGNKTYVGFGRKKHCQIKRNKRLSRKLSLTFSKNKKLKWLENLVNGDICFDYVKNIEKLPKEKTYDLETDKFHNYFLDGVLVHNTARIGYTADLLLGIERNVGTSKVRIAQETKKEEFFIATDTYIFVLDSRRTGSRKIKIKCHLDEKGFIAED